MEKNVFIKNFANQFEYTDESVFTPDTHFRNLDEWGSLIGLAVLNMIYKKYGVRVSPSEFRGLNTIDDVYLLVQSKL